MHIYGSESSMQVDGFKFYGQMEGLNVILSKWRDRVTHLAKNENLSVAGGLLAQWFDDTYFNKLFSKKNPLDDQKDFSSVLNYIDDNRTVPNKNFYFNIVIHYKDPEYKSKPNFILGSVRSSHHEWVKEFLTTDEIFDYSFWDSGNPDWVERKKIWFQVNNPKSINWEINCISNTSTFWNVEEIFPHIPSIPKRAEHIAKRLLLEDYLDKNFNHEELQSQGIFAASKALSEAHQWVSEHPETLAHKAAFIALKMRQLDIMDFPL